MTTIHAQIAAARQHLRDAGIPAEEAARDARLLAQHVLGWDAASLLTSGDRPPTDDFVERYRSDLNRRVAREPLAYIIGRQDFWTLTLEVSSAVLIPRPETELVVEAALDRLPLGGRSMVADVCTGSGCIAVALATARPGAHVVATDISAAALGIAGRNAARYAVSDRVRFLLADLLNGIGGPFDLIVSNPPYVPNGDLATLQPEVRDFEPPLALFAGDTGLDVIRTLVDQSALRLKPGGLLIFEFGAGQAPAVGALIADSRQLTMEAIVPDLQGLPRVAIARGSILKPEARSLPMSCLFCKIIRREIPASIVYEDDHVLAFNDINPQAPTHVLIVPKRHIETLNLLEADDDQLVGELHRRAAAIAQDRGISSSGYRTVFNTNRDAGQTVFHIHLHLIGGRALAWPPG